VNVSDAFLFSQRPRSLVAFHVELSSILSGREDLASEFQILKKSVLKDVAISRDLHFDAFVSGLRAADNQIFLFNFLLIMITSNKSTINIVIMIIAITTLTLLKASHGDCCEDVGSLLRELPRRWDMALQLVLIIVVVVSMIMMMLLIHGPSIFKMMTWIIIITTMIRPRWIDVPHSINGLVDYSGRFNDYDNVIYDAHLGEGSPLDCMY